MATIINEDPISLIVDDIGDVKLGGDHGLYYHDTRFLSRYELRIARVSPTPLASRNLAYYHAVHVLTNPGVVDISEGSLGISRSQTVGDSYHEDIDITSYADTAIELTLEMLFEADFLTILEIRGQIITGAKEKRQRKGRYWASAAEDGTSLSLHYREASFSLTTFIHFSRPIRLSSNENRAYVDVEVPPHGTWQLCVDIIASSAEPAKTLVRPRHGRPEETEGVAQLEEQEKQLLSVAPRVDSDNHLLSQAYQRSMRDFAALRLRGEGFSPKEFAIAAGIPWFMALFGRDSLITSYQALPYLPEVARSSLRALAKYQGKKVNPVTGEEPGKILHEFRTGEAAKSNMWIPSWPYYGTIDATPLFIILFSEVYRTSDDLDFVEELFESAERALEWMDRYGDRDGDGYLEYINETGIGLENQGWKDSWNAIQFHDGRIAKPPIALCEVQGYAYDAKVRMAELYENLGNRERAKELRQQADDLKERFNKDFWLADRNCYAIALDSDKKPVDGLASNQGHGLWTGIVDKSKSSAVVDVLTSQNMFSGWGVRTMGKSEAGYSPLGYHVGSVWPHDNSIIAAGLARYGFKRNSLPIIESLLQVIADRSTSRLPELFSGYGKDQFPFPVSYPIASGIQAWASGAPLLLLTSLLGLSIDAPRRKIYLDPQLPEDTNHLEVDGIYVGRGRLHFSVERTYGELRTKLRQVPRGFKVEGVVSHWSIFW